MKKSVCWFLVVMLFCVVVSSGCGGSSSSSSSNNNSSNNSGSVDFQENTSETFSASDLEGTWIGSNGTGSGSNQKYLPNQVVPLTVEYVECTISNINYDETSGTGTASMHLQLQASNSQYNLNESRNKTIRSCSMSSNGHNSWNFSTTYSDGSDAISITLSSTTEGLFHNVSVAWNEDDPSDRLEYELNCKINKQ